MGDNVAKKCSFCSAFVCFGCGKRVHNAHMVVWEHVCGGFLLPINMLDVCMMSEVVWKNFVLLCVHEGFCSTVVCLAVHDLLTDS